MSEFGVLAIWNDCRAGHEAEFEEWFQGEHLVERLAVPGFLFGRRHQAISGASGYFNFYLTETPAVLTSNP
jgi:heme-degrading monooxygenase HmoA